jgi:hypothetical protein
VVKLIDFYEEEKNFFVVIELCEVRGSWIQPLVEATPAASQPPSLQRACLREGSCSRGLWRR